MDTTSPSAHRPWAKPSGSWVMAQRWHDLLFAHWPVSAAHLRALVPPELELDTFRGEAWVGIVPFRMSGIRLRWTPPVPWLSAFPELNLRTYVRHGDKPGVWFFTLEATQPLAVEVARRWFHLPYHRARIECRREGQEVRYASERTDRRGAPARFVARYGPCEPARTASPGTLEHWLVERYCLYALAPGGSLWRGEIDHPPWRIQAARAHFAENTLAAAHSIDLGRCQPLLHFVRRQEVVVWGPERVA